MTPHPARAPGPLSVAVLTVSDTRTVDSDVSGKRALELLRAAGHGIHAYRILPDDPVAVRTAVREWLDHVACDAVVVNGGTGISARDATYEAVSGMLDKRLDGFGELFRMLSFHQVGSSAMLSRAVGGVALSKPVFALPGSPDAVALALEKLIIPELPHLAAELRKHGDARQFLEPGGVGGSASMTGPNEDS